MASVSEYSSREHPSIQMETRLTGLLRTYDTWVMPLRKLLLIILILSICTDFRLLGGSLSLRLYTLVTLVLLGLNMNKLRETFLARPIQWMIWFLFAGWLVLGGLFAENQLMFLKQLALLLVFFSVTVAVVTSRSAGTPTGVISAALFVGIFLAIAWGWRDLLGFLGIVPVENAYWRPKSFFEEGNEFGQFMVLGFGYLLAAFMFGERWQAFIAISLFGLMLPLLLINNSRGSYVGFAVECIVLVYLAIHARVSERVRKRSRLFLLGFILLGSTSIVAMQNVQLFKDETFAEFMLHRVKSFFTSGDETVNLRKQYSSVAWDQFLQNPLMGIGMGNLSGPLDNAVFDENGLLVGGDATSSNWVLDLLTETGLVGFFLMLCFLGTALIQAFRRLGQIQVGRDYALVAGNILACAGMLINGISYPQIYLASFWMVTGLLLSYNMSDISSVKKAVI